MRIRLRTDLLIKVYSSYFCVLIYYSTKRTISVTLFHITDCINTTQHYISGVVTKRLQSLQVMFKFSVDLIRRSRFFLPPLYVEKLKQNKIGERYYCTIYTVYYTLSNNTDILPVNRISEYDNEFCFWLNVSYVMWNDKVWLHGRMVLRLIVPMSVVPKCRCTALTWRNQMQMIVSKI